MIKEIYAVRSYGLDIDDKGYRIVIDRQPDEIDESLSATYDEIKRLGGTVTKQEVVKVFPYISSDGEMGHDEPCDWTILSDGQPRDVLLTHVELPS